MNTCLTWWNPSLSSEFLLGQMVGKSLGAFHLLDRSVKNGLPAWDPEYLKIVQELLNNNLVFRWNFFEFLYSSVLNDTLLLNEAQIALSGFPLPNHATYV